MTAQNMHWKATASITVSAKILEDHFRFTLFRGRDIRMEMIEGAWRDGCSLRADADGQRNDISVSRRDYKFARLPRYVTRRCFQCWGRANTSGSLPHGSGVAPASLSVFTQPRAELVEQDWTWDKQLPSLARARA